VIFWSGDTSPGLSVAADGIASGQLTMSGGPVNPLLGEIRMFAGNFAPKGWALCEGQLLPIREYTALFSIFGTAYGGDGTQTFALPNLKSKAPLHGEHGVFIIALEGVYPSRN
jgi:microcystin-dependent protein